MTNSHRIGRVRESDLIETCLSVNKNVLLEGPVGSGKTYLATSVLEKLNRPYFRIDGDSRYSEQKLAGWFDPPSVLKSGYGLESFYPGPLVQAMKAGGVLFINEINRLPEGVQNILLPAIDERRVDVPRLGEIVAQSGFLVIATQNPKEFIGTSHLSEAVLDRFEWIYVDYQSEEDELEIVSQKTSETKLAQASVKIVRSTRSNPQIRRGASVRAAISIAEIASHRMKNGEAFEDALLKAVLIALPNRIEIEAEAASDNPVREELKQILLTEVEKIFSTDEKKKNN